MRPPYRQATDIRKVKARFLGIGLDVDTATMRLGNLGGDVQSEPEALGIVAHMAAVKRLEQVLEHFRRDRIARIGHAQFERTVFIQSVLHADGSAFIAVSYCIAE